MIPRSQDGSAEVDREGRKPGEMILSAEERIIRASVNETVLDPAAAEAAAWSPQAGAVVVFSGIVRDHDGGQGVNGLTYSAHPSAESELQRVALHVAKKYSSVRIWVGHRIGSLGVGDHALVAAVASGHRAEAFAACSELVEEIKAEVPIWKEQYFSDGTREWVGL